VDFIQWIDTEKTAIYINAPQTISEQDVALIIAKIETMCDSVDYPLNLIVDRRNTVTVPRKTLIAMRKILSQKCFRRLVFIGFTTFPRMLVETLARLPSTFFLEPTFVDDLEEACQELDITNPIISDDPKTASTI